MFTVSIRTAQLLFFCFWLKEAKQHPIYIGITVQMYTFNMGRNRKIIRVNAIIIVLKMKVNLTSEKGKILG